MRMAIGNKVVLEARPFPYATFMADVYTTYTKE
jgi:hypothetical protein